MSDNILTKEFNLFEFTIEDILKQAKKENFSGMLFLEDTKEKGEIRFNRGAIIYAKLGSLDGERAIYSFILWLNGRACFIPFSTSDEGAEEKNITYETEFLIESCLRERTSVSQMRELVPSLDCLFEVIDSGSPTYIKTDELTVLPWVDGKNTVRDIGQEMGRDYVGVIKSIYKLCKNNIICRH